MRERRRRVRARAVEHQAELTSPELRGEATRELDHAVARPEDVRKRDDFGAARAMLIRHAAHTATDVTIAAAIGGAKEIATSCSGT